MSTLPSCAMAARSARHSRCAGYAVLLVKLGRATGVAVTLGLTGCATVDEVTCTDTDWYGVGVEDGYGGLPVSHLKSHQDSCARHGIVPDPALYADGHVEGVKQLCEPSRAFSFGVAGGQYRGTCPERLAERFSRAYSAGHELYEMEQRLESLNIRINDSRRAIRNLQTEERRTSRQVQEKSTATGQAFNPNERRARLEEELRRSAAERERHERIVAQLEDEVARETREINHYRRELMAKGYPL